MVRCKRNLEAGEAKWSGQVSVGVENRCATDLHMKGKNKNEEGQEKGTRKGGKQKRKKSESLSSVEGTKNSFLPKEECIR